MVDFSKLKKNSGKKSLEDLNKKLSSMASGEGKSSDDRYWNPATDKAGNGYAVIRFLPAPGDEDVPFVRMFSHGFKGPKGLWYIENSLTTIGKDDPVSEYNSKLWNSGIDADKEVARKQKRQLRFISNVYVIDDSANPENNGKVFLFRYGKKIFDKLNEAMNPQFEDEEAVNPFDLWNGANFKLKIRQVEGYRNYDKSSFDSPGPLFDDDEKMEEIWKKEYSLQDIIAPSNFKPYEELKERLMMVLDDGTGHSFLDGSAAKAEDEELPWDNEKETPAPKEKAKSTPKFNEMVADDEEDDDSLEFFKNLANK